MSEASRQPAPGDLYVSERSADFPVEWMVVGADPARPGRLLVVAADAAPFAAGGDVAVPAAAPGGPLTLRSRFTVSVEPEDLLSEHRVGSLPELFVAAVRERSAQLAAGTYRPTVLEQETEADPEYRDWQEEVLAPATAALAAGPRQRSPVRPPRPVRMAKWPSTLAALFLLTSIGLSFWVADLRREVDTLSAPVVLSEAFPVPVGDGLRSPTTIIAPKGASHLLIEAVLDAGIKAYERYRLELRDAAGRNLLQKTLWPRPEQGVFRLLLGRAAFPDGEYNLVIQGESPEGPVLLDESRLIVTSRP